MRVEAMVCTGVGVLINFLRPVAVKVMVGMGIGEPSGMATNVVDEAEIGRIVGVLVDSSDEPKTHILKSTNTMITNPPIPSHQPLRITQLTVCCQTGIVRLANSSGPWTSYGEVFRISSCADNEALPLGSIPNAFNPAMIRGRMAVAPSTGSRIEVAAPMASSHSGWRFWNSRWDTLRSTGIKYLLLS